jgi:hypothetical protein
MGIGDWEEGRGNREEGTNFYYQLAISNYHLPITNSQFSITNYPLPITIMLICAFKSLLGILAHSAV